jgi:hypothetical protein
VAILRLTLDTLRTAPYSQTVMSDMTPDDPDRDASHSGSRYCRTRHRGRDQIQASLISSLTFTQVRVKISCPNSNVKDEVGGLTRGIRSRFAAVGASAVLSGTLLFGFTGTAEAAPAATAAPAPVSTSVVLTSSSTAAPAAGIVKADRDDWWRKKHKRCHRVWHRASWYWWHHHRSFKRGWWSCRWW